MMSYIQKKAISVFICLLLMSMIPVVAGMNDYEDKISDANPSEEEINTPSDCGCEGCELEINFTSNPYSWGITLIIKNIGNSNCTDVKWKVIFFLLF